MKISTQLSQEAALYGARNVVRGPRSMFRVLGLFDAVSGSSNGVRLCELTGLMRAPRSSLLSLLRPLVADGYLTLIGRRYRLGPSSLRLAGTIMSVSDVTFTVLPYLKELSERTGECTFVGRLNPFEKCMTCENAIASAERLHYTVPIARTVPLYITAAGCVLLAFADWRWREKYLRTEGKWNDGALRAKLEHIRETRLAVFLGEIAPESAAIAAPIFDANGVIARAIAIGAPTSRMICRLAEWKDLVADVASRASGRPRRS